MDISSESDLRARLGDIGWSQIIVLRDADPLRLTIWEAAGHLHSKTEYRLAGERVGVIQAEGEGLTQGRLVTVRGFDGVKADGILYWEERAFILSISPGTGRLAAKLHWVSTID